MSDAVVIAIIGGGVSLLGVVIGGYINYRIGQIHKQINSRMDQLLAMNKAASKAEGNLEGRADLKNEQEKK
jgi:uncharacterized membrane protein YgaE (UPF0421/DUF939 family)